MGDGSYTGEAGVMDHLSADDLRLVPAALIGPMTRMSEKLAGIEGRFGAKIEALSDDTTKIRQTMHDMANAQQAAISVERQFAMQLSEISTQLKAHADQVSINVGAQQAAMLLLGGKVEALTISHHQMQGMWWTLAKIAAVLAAVAAILWPHARHFLIES